MDTLHPVAQEPYRDRKRYAWLFSLLVPSIVGIGPALVLATGDPRMLWIQVVFFYLVLPVLDLLMGEDLSNPPESAVPALEADMYYRWVTYLLAPFCGAPSFSVPGLWLPRPCRCTACWPWC